MYLLFYKFKKEERKVNSMKAKMYSVSKFELDGRPALKEAIPLGLQHVLAMFVGNIVPMILVAATAGLSASESNMLLQCCMIGAAISTEGWWYTDRFGSSLHDGSYICIPTGVSFNCRKQRRGIYLWSTDCSRSCGN